MSDQRCACRPGCLTWLDDRDRTVSTSAGIALASHVGVQPYPEALGRVVVVVDERQVAS